jgi:hypothetical protein
MHFGPESFPTQKLDRDDFESISNPVLNYARRPPYVVLRRIGRAPIDEPGDHEWYMGHRPRVWAFWKRPYPRWEKMHLATHDGLFRFRSIETARAYVDCHDDMGFDELIEFVEVRDSANDEEPFEGFVPWDENRSPLGPKG